MAVTYKTFDGKRVSYDLWLILTAARADGVKFTLNSGKRTIPEQWGFYNNQPPLAAYPDPDAPHILEGRWWHALDIDAVWGGAERFRKWAKTQGITFVYSVPGESWHLQIQNATSEEIRRKFEKADPFSFLTDKDTKLIKEAQRTRKGAADRGRWLVSEKARVWSIKRYLKRKIRALKRKKNPTTRERKRLGYLRDALAGRKLD